MTQERVAYVNGEIVPESLACVSIRDKGLVYGDSVFDTARTFNGKLFRLEEHIDRLFRSLELARIDPGVSKQSLIDATCDLLERNLPVLRPGEDYWVTQRVTSGVQVLDGEPPSQQGPTIVIDCIPIPLRARARFFQQGIEAAIPERKRISPEALSPNIKSNNYLNMFLAQRELQDDFPAAWALMCDPTGNIAEGAGCNFFMVKDNTVYTPTAQYILCGISRDVVMELCSSNNIALQETDISKDFALSADEAFFTSTSLCVCPVKSLNGHELPGGIPGAVSGRIMTLFAELAGFDFVAQYTSHLGADPGSTGL